MREYLRRIDTDTIGNRYDVTPLFADAESFDALIMDLAEPFRESVDLVGCVDALGFILGTGIARELSVGVLAIRKGGKLPVAAAREDFVDYTGLEKALELRRDALGSLERVLLVDEWIETGAQIGAALSLIERNGGSVVGVATIHMDRNANTDAIRAKHLVRIASEL